MQTIKEWGTEIIEKCFPIATALDSANQTDKYSASLEIASRIIQNPENSISAYDHMIENGAENVSLFDGGKLNHGECAGPSIFGGLLWLQQYYEECEPESVTNLNDMDWTIAPNPAPQGTITLIGVPSQTRWNVRDLTGRVVNYSFISKKG